MGPAQGVPWLQKLWRLQVREVREEVRTAGVRGTVKEGGANGAGEFGIPQYRVIGICRAYIPGIPAPHGICQCSVLQVDLGPLLQALQARLPAVRDHELPGLHVGQRR